MVKTLTALSLFGVLLLSAAAPVDAAVYVTTLKNGGRIESRDAPRAVDYAPGRLLVLTEVGNWIALSIDEIASIEANTSSQIFGTVINTTTVTLGEAPNDKVEAEALDPQARLLQLMEERSRPRPDYSVQQFAEPSQSSGIPTWMTGVTTPPLGRAGGPMPMSGAQPNGQ